MELWEQFSKKELVTNLERLRKKYPSFKYSFDDDPNSKTKGKPIIMIGQQKFDTPAEAVGFIRSLNVTNVDTFDGALPAYKQPMVGGQMFLGLNQLADELQKSGISFDRIGINNKGRSQEQAKKAVEVFGGDNPNALIWSRKDTTTGLMFYEKGKPGKPLARSKIMQILEELGFEFDEKSKTIKRLSALTNEYQLGMSGVDVNINGLFFDPTQTERGRKLMTDGGYRSVRGATEYSYRVAKSGAAGLKGFVDRTGKAGLEAMRVYQDKGKLALDESMVKSIEENYRKLYGSSKLFADIDQSELLEVGRFIETQKVALKSVDGAVFGSAKLARGIQDAMTGQAKALKESLDDAVEKGVLSITDPDYINGIKNIESLTRNAQKLGRAAIHGDVFNVRIMNYLNIADEFLGQDVKDLIGQVKGNITIIGEKKGLQNWTKQVLDYVSGYGGQIEVVDGKLVNAAGKTLSPEEIQFIAPMSSETMEFRTVSGSQAQRMGGRVSLETLGQGQRVFIDPQVLYADPELLDSAAIRMVNLRDVAEKIDYLKSDKILEEYNAYKLDLELDINTEKPGGILGGLLEAADSKVDDKGRRSAQQMLDLLDEGIGPKQNPLFAQEFLSAVKEYTSGKPGVPKLLVPLVMRAEIGTTLTSGNEVRDGFISYSKGQGFRLNDWDYYKYHKSFGGFDLDDMLGAHMAWDRGSDSLLSITKRTPGARGEIALFKVDLNDQLTDEVLENASKANPAAKAHMDAIRLTEARIKAKAGVMLEANPSYTSTGEVLSQNLESMKDVDIFSLSVDEITDEQRIFKGLIDTGTEFTRSDREALRVSGVGTQSLQELEQELLSLRLGGERKSIMRALVEEAGRGFSRQEIKDLTRRSIDVGGEREALKGLGKYTTFKELILQRGAEDPTVVKKTFEELLTESLEGASKNQGILEKFSNFVMVFNSAIATTEIEGGEKAKLAMEDIIRLLPQEDVIDSITKEGGEYADDVSKLTDDGINSLADAMVNNGVRIDRAMIENDFGKSKLSAQWVDQISRRIQETTGSKTASIDDYLIEGRYSKFMEQSRYTVDLIERQFREASKSLGLVKELEGELFDLDIEKEADEILEMSKTAFKEYDPFGGLDLDDLKRNKLFFGDLGLEDEASIAAVKTLEARREFSRQLMERGYLSEVDDGIEMSERGRRVVGSLMQRRGLGSLPAFGDEAVPGLLGGELSDVFQTTLSWFQNLKSAKGGQVPTVGATGETGKFIREQVIPYERPQEVARAIEDMPEMAPGRAAYGRARAARNASDDIVSAGAESASRLKRIDLSSMKELFGNKTFKKGAIATGGLVAFSAIYQKVKDRTPEDLAGPPMLPGGSFYSGQKTGGQEINPISQQSGQSGVTYRVRATGNFNPEEFSNSMGNITGADVRTSNYQTRGYQRKRSPIEEAINGSFR